MTTPTPIKRAIPDLFEAIMSTDEYVPVEVRIAMLTREDRDTFYAAARAVFASIRTDDLADVIAEHIATVSGWPGRGDKMRHNAVPIAQAVKAHLTQETS